MSAYSERMDAEAARDQAMLDRVKPPTLDEIADNATASISLFDDEGKKRTQADVLVDIGLRHHLFHDAGGQPFAQVKVGHHKQVHAVESSGYRELLAHDYYKIASKGCNRNALVDAITTLCAKAKFEGKMNPVWLRVARDGHDVVIDSGTDDWTVIRVTANGWRMESGGSVCFYRAGKPLSLPTPKDASFSLIWQYLNIAEADRVLVAAFLLASLRPFGPYPGLILNGEQGAGKSMLTKLIKRIIDPSASALRSPPKEPRDLLVGALNSWLLCIDNLSWLPATLSDALCRISTGGAISERTLYSNLDETLVEVTRPVILNGIEEIATRPDLAERGIHIELQPIVHRRTERELLDAFEKDAPAIFAGLLDGLVHALHDVDGLHLDHLPRMADFALWAEAGLPALGFQRGEFIRAYRENQQAGLSLGLESSAIGRAVSAFMAGRTEWTGSATDLLSNLVGVIDENTTRTPAWPKNARSLRGHLNRIAPALRSAGIGLDYERTGRERLIALCSCPVEPSLPSQPSQTAQPRHSGVTVDDANMTVVTQSFSDRHAGEPHNSAICDGHDANDGTKDNLHKTPVGVAAAAAAYRRAKEGE